MDKKQLYLQKLEAQLREWDGMWHVAKARASKRTTEAKLDGLDLLERLEKKRAQASQKVEALKASADDAWESVGSQAEALWSELSDGIAAVKEKLGLSDREPK